MPPAHKVSKSVVALLKAYGWTKFAIVAGDELTSAEQQMDAIKVTLICKYFNFLKTMLLEGCSKACRAFMIKT